jgi:predicted tellurium resistance membrane protein TerC
MKRFKFFGLVLVAILPALLVLAFMSFVFRDLIRKPHIIGELAWLVLLPVGIAIASAASVGITIWLAQQVWKQSSD